MKYKIFFTILLFLFSLFYLYKGVSFIRENDHLMQEIKNVQDKYNQLPTNAIITKNTMIPGISGKKINLKQSYQKMKKINSFNESLLVFEKIKPQKTIANLYNKILLSGNPNKKQISIILDINNEELFNSLNHILISNNIYADILSNQNYNLLNTNYINILSTSYNQFSNYCLTFNLAINKECTIYHKYTLLGTNINNYHLSKTKDLVKNGIILVYSFNENNYNELNVIIKYLKNNQYQLVTIDKLITE